MYTYVINPFGKSWGILPMYNLRLPRKTRKYLICTIILMKIFQYYRDTLSKCCNIEKDKQLFEQFI